MSRGIFSRKAIGILVHTDTLQDSGFFDVLRQWELHQNTMNLQTSWDFVLGKQRFQNFGKDAADHPACRRNQGFSIRLWIIVEFLDFCQEFLSSRRCLRGALELSANQFNSQEYVVQGCTRPRSHNCHDSYGPLLVIFKAQST